MLANLALVGFGNVGRRLARLLDERRAELQRQFNLTWRITGVATRRHGSIYNARGIDASQAAQQVEAGQRLTTDGEPVSGSDEVIDRLAGSTAPLRVLLETTTLDIAAGQPARDHVARALQLGCNVATANKGPAAFAYRELSDLARKNGVRFLFEGAVMDGIPNLQSGARDDANGTCRGISGRCQQHDQSHTDGARGWRGVRAGAGRDAGAGHRRGGSFARRRWLGRGRQGCSADERAPGRTRHAARRRPDRDQRDHSGLGAESKGQARFVCASSSRRGAANARSSSRRNCRKPTSSPIFVAWPTRSSSRPTRSGESSSLSSTADSSRPLTRS